MIDDIDNKSREQQMAIRSRFDFYSHIYDLIFIGLKALYSVFIALIICLSAVHILASGMYTWMRDVINAINSLDWPIIIMIIVCVGLKTIHSISISYFRMKFERSELLNQTHND